MTFLRNPCLLTDSYKPSHWLQYPPGTEHVYSYFESRGGAFEELQVVGLRYLLEEYLARPVTLEDVQEAEPFWAAHFGTDRIFNQVGWMHIVQKHGGRIPLRIKALPEGTIVEPRCAILTVENTDPGLPWLTNWFETLLSQLWYPITVASQSRYMRGIIRAALERSGDPAGIDFKLHDFGFRGVSSVETAALGGFAHLAAGFRGTDTAAALEMARRYYDEPMAGFSIPAAEHSTITSWGREREVDAFRNMVQQFGGGALYAVVSDSWDILHACSHLWGEKLKAEVLAANGTLVVRPDSGEPTHIVPRVISLLAEKFGAERNAKGYYVLNPKVRVIQGDGIDRDTIGPILDAVMDAGFSADNLAFGSGGGGLLQKVNRDTCKFAFKCSWIGGSRRNEEDTDFVGWSRDVFKDPITDPGKNSKRGRFKVVRLGSRLVTVAEHELPEMPDELVLAFEDGQVLARPTLAEIRQRAS